MAKTFLPELLNFSRAKRSVVPMSPEEFHKIRKAAGLTQNQMAERLGVTRLTICNWEGAKFRIPDDVLDRLAEKGIGVTPAGKPDSSQARQDKQALKAYTAMRADTLTHGEIISSWHREGFTPSPEAQAAIAAAFPDILEGARAPLVLQQKET